MPWCLLPTTPSILPTATKHLDLLKVARFFVPIVKSYLNRSLQKGINIKSRRIHLSVYCLCVLARKALTKAWNERLVSLAGNRFWLTFFGAKKWHHFICTEMGSKAYGAQKLR